MTVYTEHLIEAMGLTEAEEESKPFEEGFSVLDSVDGGLSEAHKSLNEPLTIAESLAVDWNNSTFHDILAGEYMTMQDSVFGWIQGTVYTVNLTEAISVLEVAARDVTFSLTEALTLAETLIESGRTLEEALTVVETVTAYSGKSLHETMDIVETVARQITANRALEEELSLADYVAGIIFRNGYAYYGDGDVCPTTILTTIEMELWDDALTNVSIKLPEFGDQHTARTSIISNGDIYIKRYLSDDKITMNFTGVLEKADMIAFYNACRGRLIMLTDQYGNMWQGFLTNNRLSVKTIFEHATCDDFGFGFEFQGKRLPEGD